MFAVTVAQLAWCACKVKCLRHSPYEYISTAHQMAASAGRDEAEAHDVRTDIRGAGSTWLCFALEALEGAGGAVIGHAAMQPTAALPHTPAAPAPPSGPVGLEAAERLLHILPVPERRDAHEALAGRPEARARRRHHLRSGHDDRKLRRMQSKNFDGVFVKTDR